MAECGYDGAVCEEISVEVAGFDIEDIDPESEFILRKIRRTIADKIANYLRFTEIIINPSNAPMFFFKLLKKLTSEDKEGLSKIYESLGDAELKMLSLDVEYNESEEAKFINEMYKAFTTEIKSEFLKAIDKLNKSLVKRNYNPCYWRMHWANQTLQPSFPLEVPPVKGVDPRTGEEIERSPDDTGPLSALVFKIVTDPFVGRLAYFRVYSGKVSSKARVQNSTRSKTERIGRVIRMYADRREEIDEVRSGDIAATVGLKETLTGETLSDPTQQIVLESITFPDPVISVAIEPKTTADQDKMSGALRKLAEEDPTFQVRTDEASGQTIISGMGELHLDIIVDRLRREFKVEVNQGQPQVEYKEAVTRVADHREVYKKQSGGRGKFADIVFTLEPAEEGKIGLEFVNEVKGGNVPKEFIPAVEKGFKQAMANGPLAGFEVDSMKVTLKDGSFHPVDSDALSFELAAKIGFKEVAKKAGAVILEPIMKLEVLTPEENMGDIVGDLNRRRGTINNMADRAGAKVIKAEVPLSEMFGYVTTLRTLSSGRATSTMEFSHYAETPSNISESVIAAARGTANV